MIDARHIAEDEAQLYLEGAIEPSEAVRIDGHLAGCVECQALVASYEALSEALSALPIADPPADFTVGVMARIDEREASRAAEREVTLAVLGVVAVALVGGLALAGQAAWGPVLSAVSSSGVRLLQAFRLSSDVLSPVVSVLRLQIAGLTALVAIPLFLALFRLAAPRHGQAA
ncbi:MAG: zf-HC2 domain-containing protein [Anaeromyxobacteraceae bacterium]